MGKCNVTRKEYSENLEILMSLALKYNSSATEAAAELILSMNSGPYWKCNLINLRSLDDDNFEAAIKSICGYRKYAIYPYQIIQDAEVRLPKLKEKYNYLAIKNHKRYGDS